MIEDPMETCPRIINRSVEIFVVGTWPDPLGSMPKELTIRFTLIEKSTKDVEILITFESVDMAHPRAGFKYDARYVRFTNIGDLEKRVGEICNSLEIYGMISEIGDVLSDEIVTPTSAVNHVFSSCFDKIKH